MHKQPEMSSQDSLAHLWYSTANPYYRDVYFKAYGRFLGDIPPVNSTAGTIGNAPIADPDFPFEGLTQFDELQKLADSHTRLQTSTPKPKKFLELPPEIRNKIYGFSLLYETPITGITSVPAIGLLRTCKQIHEEASSILYGENCFTFTALVGFKGFAEIRLVDYPDTRKTAVWPAKSYHQYLSALHIRIGFNSAEDQDLNVPPIFEQQIQAMRDAYDEAWVDLSLTIEFISLPSLSFTSFWLKMSLFEPLRHPGSKIIIPSNYRNPEITHFLLNNILRSESYVADLADEQLDGYREAKEIALFSHERNLYSSCDALAGRMAYANPSYSQYFFHGFLPQPPKLPKLMLGGAVQNPQPQTQTQMFQVNPAPQSVSTGLVGPSQPRTKTVLQLKDHLQTILGSRNPRIVQWLVRDDELRLFAAMRFPERSKDLIPDDSVELKIYVAMVLNLAGKWGAQSESLRDALKAAETKED